jgi:hypothetical protein
MIHLSKLIGLSLNNYEDVELCFEYLDKNDWIYYENLNQYKVE